MTLHLLGATRRAQRERAEQDDAGFTLIEVLASMSILSIFLAMFTATLIQVFGASNKANAVNDSSAQISLAFLRLDREIRYAAAIDQPTHLGNGNWYVEFATQNTGTSVCTQLKLANGVLFERSWTPAPTTAPTWNALASGITNAAVAPFTFYPTDDAHIAQRLQLNLLVTAGTGTAQTTSTTNVSFTAMNSSKSTKTNSAGTLICQDQGTS